MSALLVEKVVSSLPGTLAPNTVYAVRVGEGFDLYITDSTGAVAHRNNSEVVAYVFDGGAPDTDYTVGPAFDCGGVD